MDTSSVSSSASGKTYRLKVRLPVLLLSFLFATLAVPSCLDAKDWSDLDEPDIYGSETEGKYTNFVFTRFEDWVNEKGQRRQSFHFLWLLRGTWYPRYNSYTFFPLYYRQTSKIDERRKTILFPLYYRRYEDPKNDFITMPLFLFYRNVEGGDSTTIFGPGYYRDDVDSKGNSRYAGAGVFPLFHYGWERHSGKESEERSLLLYPLLSYFEWSENSTFHLVPFLPVLYYRNFETYGSGSRPSTKSTTYVIPFYWHSTKSDTASYWKFWILPVLYTAGGGSADERASRGFFHFFPLFYYDHNRDENRGEDSRRIMFPSLPFLFYSSSSENTALGTDESTFYLFPVYLSNAKSKTSSGSATAVFPFFLRLRSDERRKTYILPSIYYSSDQQTGETSYGFFPFFSYGYQPPTETSEGRFSLWAIPFYRWRNEESSGSHVLPVYWYETGKNNDFAMITPLYWSRTERDSDGETTDVSRIGIPFLYYHRWKEEGKERNTFWLLAYYSWNHAKSEGSFVPWHYHSSDSLKEYDLYLAFSTSQSLAKIENGGLYLDSDYTFGYNVLSFSSRIPLISREQIPSNFRRTEDADMAPETLLDTGKGVKQPEQKVSENREGPQIVRGKEVDPFDRTNTRLFYSWSVLFGWTSYISADTKRHFRILPLMWLSWDKADEKDKLTYIPFAYLDYRNGEERYRAVFPLFLPIYGRYEKGETFVETWGGPIYIGSYDAETKERETSILWPFFKYYGSPDTSGMRLFPIFSWKRWQEGDTTYTRSFSWLHYASGQTVTNAEETRTESFVFSPLYLSSSQEWERKTNPTGSTSHQSSWKYFPLPLLFFGREDDRRSVNFAFISGGSRGDHSSSFYILPLYYYSREETEAGERTNRWVFNLYHHYEDPATKVADTDIIWPLFETWSKGDEQGWNLFPLFAWKQKVAAGETNTTTFSPLHYYNRETGGSNGKESTNFWLLNLYHRESNSSKDFTETDNWLLWPLFRRHQEAHAYTRCTQITTRWRLYPLIYHTTQEDEPNGSEKCNEGETTTFVFPAIYRNRSTGWATDFYFGYYRHSSPSSGYHNLLFLFDFEYGGRDGLNLGLLLGTIRYRSYEGGSRFKLFWGLLADWEIYDPAPAQKYAGGYDFRFLNYIQRNNSKDYGREFKTAFWPILSYYSAENEMSFWFLPTLEYHVRKEKDTEDYVLGGLLWYRNIEPDRFKNTNWILSGIIYRQDTKWDRRYTIRGSLWGALWAHENEAETGYDKVTVLYGLVFKKVEHPKGNRRYAKLFFIPIYDEPITDGPAQEHNGQIEPDTEDGRLIAEATPPGDRPTLALENLEPLPQTELRMQRGEEEALMRLSSQ